MNFASFTGRDLQNCQMLLTMAESNGIVDVRFLRQKIQRHIDNQRRVGSVQAARYRRSLDNITICSVCGSPALIVPLEKGDRTTSATHAVQCQNRPAIDKPWRDGMCGHTEYIAMEVK